MVNAIARLLLFVMIGLSAQQQQLIHALKSLSTQSYSNKKHLLESASIIRQKLPNTTTPLPPRSVDLSFPSSVFIRTDGTSRGFCNWLIKDKIMIGRYPAQGPEKDGPSLYDAKQHVQTMINDAKIRVFCSLQSEIPSQDDHKAWAKQSGKIRLADGGNEFPNFFGHYEPLVRQSLETNKKKKNMINVTFLHAPILDLDTPTSQSLYELLSTLLKEMIEQNDDAAIYIHCWGGRGRAGLVGACLLSLIYPELDADSCLAWIQKGYDTREGSKLMPSQLKRSPQTQRQRDFVKNFVEEVRK